MANKNSGVKTSFAEGAGLTKAKCPSGFYRNKEGKCVQKGVGPQYKP
tara:strand:- start:19 stop:159 length:141 start_codon:yes stop_codon:yes gene_type:complete